MKRRGFTLIELLIVVAIIAVLAAIAVPNFLEAQTRSKVSRAKADLRTLATALESYAVDNNTYPYVVDGTHGEWTMPDGFPPGGSRCGGLTTPIAYLTSALYDPFILDAIESPTSFGAPLGPQKLHYERLGFGFDAAGVPYNDGGSGKKSVRVCVDGLGYNNLNGTAPDFNSVNAAEMPAEYVLFSIGPDRKHRVYFDNNTVQVRSRFSILNRYDPTNGTISQGNILRFPGGLSFP